MFDYICEAMVVVCYFINFYFLYKLNKKTEENTDDTNIKVDITRYELSMLKDRIDSLEKKLNNND